jgi:beta-glucosidase/6-phospho-beta-glucosidase/beta-galactosidase
MVAMVTLHHFTHPQWFEKLGGFGKVDNLAYFLTYSEYTFMQYGKRIRLWSTFNEANVSVWYCAFFWRSMETLYFLFHGILYVNTYLPFITCTEFTSSNVYN